MHTRARGAGASAFSKNNILLKIILIRAGRYISFECDGHLTMMQMCESRLQLNYRGAMFEHLLSINYRCMRRYIHTYLSSVPLFVRTCCGSVTRFLFFVFFFFCQFKLYYLRNNTAYMWYRLQHELVKVLTRGWGVPHLFYFGDIRESRW